MTSLLISLAIYLIEKFGVAIVEARFPKLIPIINEILGVLNGNAPTPQLHEAAQRYTELQPKL